jgi:hypothetical protein
MKTAVKPSKLDSYDPKKVYYPTMSVNSKTHPPYKAGDKVEAGVEGVLKGVTKNDDGTFRCEIEVRNIDWEDSATETKEEKSKSKSKGQKDKMSEMGY